MNIKSYRIPVPHAIFLVLKGKPANGKCCAEDMKVPFSRIKFLYGSVSFQLFIEELGRELIFEIENADIRPKFDAIREYFSKTLKRKLIAGLCMIIQILKKGLLRGKVRSCNFI